MISTASLIRDYVNPINSPIECGTNASSCRESVVDPEKVLNFAEKVESCRLVAANSLQRSKFAPPHRVVHAHLNLNQDKTVQEAIEIELLKSGYPLHNIQCHCCNESVLKLTGEVSRYYYQQIAIQIMLRFAGDRRIVNEIKVVTPPKTWMNPSPN